MGPVGSLSLQNTLCPPPAPCCHGPFPPLQPPLANPAPLENSSCQGARVVGRGTGAAWGPPPGAPQGEGRMGWPRLRGGVLSLRAEGGPCPFPCSGALHRPAPCTSQGLLGWWSPPQLMLGAQGHQLARPKLLALAASVPRAGQGGQSEGPALPRRFGARLGGWTVLALGADGSQAAFWQLPPPEGCGV